MKLRNKKTGEIKNVRMSYREDTAPIVISETTCDENGQSQGWPYNSLAELNEEWEDYEEPKAYYIGRCGTIEEFDPTNDIALTEMLKEIGNYFETKEEAEKAVEKLKAWKRLKNKGFQFESWWGGSKDISFWVDTEIDEDIAKDLDLLFSQEGD